MNPELQIYAQNKLTEIISNLETVDGCGKASRMIDFYQKGNPEDKEFLQYIRNFLSDKTFELYNKKYNS